MKIKSKYVIEFTDEEVSIFNSLLYSLQSQMEYDGEDEVLIECIIPQCEADLIKKLFYKLDNTNEE